MTLLVEATENPVHQCVGAVIVRSGLILLGKRSAEREFYPHVWDVFGGHVEAHESHLQTLQRELREELDIELTACHYLETLRGADGNARVECHFFVVTRWCGRPKNHQPHEHSEIRWFHPDELCRLELAHPEYPRVLRRAVAGQG